MVGQKIAILKKIFTMNNIIRHRVYIVAAIFLAVLHLVIDMKDSGVRANVHHLLSMFTFAIVIWEALDKE